MEKKELAHQAIVELRDFARLYSIQSLFIVGGYCRAKVMGDDLNAIEDIDVASAYPGDAMRICGLFASEILRSTPKFYQRTGTGVVNFGSGDNTIRIEFQNSSVNSYKQNEDVRLWMRKNGIENSPLQNNVYGRDFSINSLIMWLKNGEFYDLTRKAVKDIEDRKIRTLLPPSLIVKYNPMIILRAIRFAVRYDFFIVPELRKAMKQNVGLLTKAYSKERLTKEIEKIFRTNTKDGLEELQKYQLMSLVIPEQLKKHVRIMERKSERNKGTNKF